MCTLLASVLGRVPSQILCSKFNASVQVMQQIVEQSDQQVRLCRACDKNGLSLIMQCAILPIGLAPSSAVVSNEHYTGCMITANRP